MVQKSRFILLPAIMFASLFSFGQKGVLPKLQVGIRVGANYANFRGLQNSNILENTNSTFIMAGVFAQVRILKKFGLRAELLSNPKGALVNYIDDNNIKVEAIRRLNYIDASLSLLYNFKVLKVVGFYAFGGYQYESLNSVKDAIQKPYTANNTITSNFAEDAHSIIAGLGLRIGISKINITPEIRYLYGLTDIATTNIETKNQVITASIGVSFSL